MFAYELEGLKRLNIQAIKWGSSYRFKVRGRTGKMVYVSNVLRPINQRLVAKQYHVSTEILEKHLSPDYKSDPKYRFYNGNHMDSHLYEGVEATDFYDKLENVLSTQASAFKVSVALEYELVSKTDPDDTRYFYPNLANTYAFNKPVAINSKSIDESSYMRLKDPLDHTSLTQKRKIADPSEGDYADHTKQRLEDTFEFDTSTSTSLDHVDMKDRDDVDLFTNEDTTKLAKAFEPRDGEARHGIKIGIDKDMNSSLTSADNEAKKIRMDYYNKIVSEGVQLLFRLKPIVDTKRDTSTRIKSYEGPQYRDDTLQKLYDESEAAFLKYGEAQRKNDEAKRVIKGNNSKSARSALKAATAAMNATNAVYHIKAKSYTDAKNDTVVNQFSNRQDERSVRQTVNNMVYQLSTTGMAPQALNKSPCRTRRFLARVYMALF
ncbi:unnamed protein product [Phytophthora lilii]|uniref:Unnamed protein product n=1 Tax=Phytophthora lilii TaxID=2077276 RepID=A0A9W6UBS8_9STRA|nr:unnamed protein product [Phytophthora lilii]